MSQSDNDNDFKPNSLYKSYVPVDFKIYDIYEWYIIIKHFNLSSVVPAFCMPVKSITYKKKTKKDTFL